MTVKIDNTTGNLVINALTSNSKDVFLVGKIAGRCKAKDSSYSSECIVEVPMSVVLEALAK